MVVSDWLAAGGAGRRTELQSDGGRRDGEVRGIREVELGAGERQRKHKHGKRGSPRDRQASTSFQVEMLENSETAIFADG